MDQRSSLPGPAIHELPNQGPGAGEAGRNPFSLGARAFSSPVAMVLGLTILAVLACGIALGGLLLLAGDARRSGAVAAPWQTASLGGPPRAVSEPPAADPPASETRVMTIAPIEALPAAAEVPAPVEAHVAEPAPAEPGSSEAPAPEAVPVQGVPIPPRRDLAGATPFTGVWAPDPAACSPRQNRRGYLPAVIGADGAWAGETSCTFENGQQTGSTWRFAAVCSNARRKWKADVRLTVTGDRLVWASQRGSQAYVRCARASRET